MTCAHVLGLIDAGPFAEYPQEHLDAARAHARECPTCGPALAAATVMTVGAAARCPILTRQADLASIVMARIAQLPEPGSSAAAVTAGAAAVRRRDWAQSVTALGGLVAGLALILTMPSGAEVLGDFVTPRFGGALAAVPSSGPAALAIGAGLLVYVVGLFAPVRSE